MQLAQEEADFFLGSEHLNVEQRPVPLVENVRLVLQYRPELRFLPRIIHKVVSTWNPSVAANCGFELDVRISWAKAGISLMHVLRNNLKW